MQRELDRNISKELSSGEWSEVVCMKPSSEPQSDGYCFFWSSATAELDAASVRMSPVGSASRVELDPVSRATQQYLEVLKKNNRIWTHITFVSSKLYLYLTNSNICFKTEFLLRISFCEYWCCRVCILKLLYLSLFCHLVCAIRWCNVSIDPSCIIVTFMFVFICLQNEHYV